MPRIPGKIVSSEVSNGIRVGRVQFGGITRETCLDFVPEASVGDYVIVHVGFAISRRGSRRGRAKLRSCSNRWDCSRANSNRIWKIRKADREGDIGRLRGE